MENETFDKNLNFRVRCDMKSRSTRRERDVCETPMATGSDLFPFLICLHITTFILITILKTLGIATWDLKIIYRFSQKGSSRF